MIKVIKAAVVFELSLMSNGRLEPGFSKIKFAYIPTHSDRMWHQYRLRRGD